jgi:hypothetical protein
VEPSREISRPAFVVVYGGSVNTLGPSSDDTEKMTIEYVLWPGDD